MGKIIVRYKPPETMRSVSSCAFQAWSMLVIGKQYRYKNEVSDYD